MIEAGLGKRASGARMDSISKRDMAKMVNMLGRPRHGKIILDVERVIAMREAGFTDVQIGEWFGVSKYTVKRRVSASGAESRWETERWHEEYEARRQRSKNNTGAVEPEGV